MIFAGIYRPLTPSADLLPAFRPYWRWWAKVHIFFPYETIAIELHSLIAEDENVVAHFRLTAQTHDGRDYANEYLFRFKCREQKIVEVWEFLDTYYQQQMGMFN